MTNVSSYPVQCDANCHLQLGLKLVIFGRHNCVVSAIAT